MVSEKICVAKVFVHPDELFPIISGCKHKVLRKWQWGNKQRYDVYCAVCDTVHDMTLEYSTRHEEYVLVEV